MTLRPTVRQTLWPLLLVMAMVLAACGGSSSSNSAGDDTANADDATSSTDAVEASPASADEATTVPPTVPPTDPPATTAAPGPEFDFSAVSPVVEEFVAERELNGAGLIVVHRDHGVIHHDHWGEFSEDRISLIASSSKMITAGVLLRLQDDGLLDIDAPVADTADWGAGNPEITTAQLLSNSSGLVGLLPNPAYAPYLCQYIPTGTLEECAAQIFNTEGDDAEITGPDVAFNYGGAQWQVAGGVAEAASGKAWADLIDEIYVQPCGLDVLAFNNHFSVIGAGFDYPTEFNSDPSILQPTANPNMEGGAYVTTGDYGKLLLMHLRDGMCGDEQVLSPDALAAMHGDRIAAAYEGDAWAPETGYGMGWWVDRPTGRLNDGGAYGSVPWLDLEDGYGAFLVVEADSSTGNNLAELLYDIIEEAATA